ncbi:hypothetical protein RIF29_19085 [Crotalaria pallida]|uniref:Uncharacterized protein n=1 Tax=Crotalaria pallida TaxID=3830 RepID=A0AAN9IB41_CROPI
MSDEYRHHSNVVILKCDDISIVRVDDDNGVKNGVCCVVKSGCVEGVVGAGDDGGGGSEGFGAPSQSPCLASSENVS